MQMSESSQAVFVSYTSQDAEAARRICESLRAAGIEVWLDQSELRGGDAWDSAIRKQIKACALFLPVISANTSARSEGYFRLEWKLAVDRSHLMAAERAFILPVVIDGTLEGDALVPDRFREVQWTSFPAGRVSAEFVARVARLLSPNAQQTASAGVRAPAKPAIAPALGRATGRRTVIAGIAAGALNVHQKEILYTRCAVPASEYR
jgi:TIR domain